MHLFRRSHTFADINGRNKHERGSSISLIATLTLPGDALGGFLCAVCCYGMMMIYKCVIVGENARASESKQASGQE